MRKYERYLQMDIMPFIKRRPCIKKKTHNQRCMKTISGSNIHDYAKSRMPFNWKAMLLNNAISKIKKKNSFVEYLNNIIHYCMNQCLTRVN